MSDFKKFERALYFYLKGTESYDSFYGEIKDLDCYDFKFFYYKAHYIYKKFGKKEKRARKKAQRVRASN